jgi:hypothetical protein
VQELTICPLYSHCCVFLQFNYQSTFWCFILYQTINLVHRYASVLNTHYSYDFRRLMDVLAHTQILIVTSSQLRIRGVSNLKHEIISIVFPTRVPQRRLEYEKRPRIHMFK